MKKLFLLPILSLLIFVTACNNPQKDTSESTIDKLTAEQISQRTEQAYYFIYPMLQGYQAIFGISLYEKSPSYFGPLNGVYSKPFTLNPSYQAVVSPNADTPYSLANADLTNEPVVFKVPAIKDRYYVMQFVDLYGYNVYYVGTRVTGTDAGIYLLVGPDWKGKVPDGITKVLHFETNLILGVGRTQLLNDADLPKLKEVVAQYKMEPLSSFEGTTAPEAKKVDWPLWNPEILNNEKFIGIANFLFTFCQPANPQDKKALDEMATIGIGPGIPFNDSTLTKEQKAAVLKGIQTAQKKMAEKARNLSPSVNGWKNLTGFGNRAYFKGDYFLKASAATVGYLANDPEEATYPVCRVDADGNKLNGANKYQLTFTEQPPNNAFWSVTMYNTLKDGTGGFLCENPINRYLINNSTKGLVKNADGSLTITMQKDEPTNATEKANWLPAPEGDFYLILRIYMPKESVLDGSWKAPAVEKIN
jgi:hypothetical protein